METLQRTANRGSISTGYDIDNSLKIEADNVERMQRGSTFIGTPTSTQKATISGWFKRTELQSSGNGIVWIGNAGAVSTILGFNNDRLDAVTSISGGFNLKSTPVFRDTSAWYHIVWAFDTTQATAANRVKLYVNGVQIEDFDTETYPNQNNAIGLYEINMSHFIGWIDAQTQSGYYSEIYLIDGQQLAPTEFGEFDEDTGIWKPKAYDGTFGNEGYYLDMSNASDLGEDQSGNDNDFDSLYNITAADQATDTPTNSFSTWNILNRYFSTTINEGATKVTNSDTSNWRSYVSTIAVSSGKWYAEFEAGGTSFIGVGDVAEITGTKSYTQYLGQIPASIGYYSVGLLFYSGASQSGSFTGFGDGDVISCALDKDNGFVYWALNGVWQNSGDPTSGASGTGGVALTSGNAGYEASDQYIIGYSPLVASSAGFANYGGFTTMSISSGNPDSAGYGNFEYAPPSGYYALCTKNLAEYG